MTSLKDHMSRDGLFSQSEGHLYMEGLSGRVHLDPVAANALSDLYLEAGSSAAVREDPTEHRALTERYFALHDAMTAAANHSPERWRDALGFLPSSQPGCAA